MVNSEQLLKTKKELLNKQSLLEKQNRSQPNSVKNELITIMEKINNINKQIYNDQYEDDTQVNKVQDVNNDQLQVDRRPLAMRPTDDFTAYSPKIFSNHYNKPSRKKSAITPYNIENNFVVGKDDQMFDTRYVKGSDGLLKPKSGGKLRKAKSKKRKPNKSKKTKLSLTKRRKTHRRK